jgi:predicted ATP-dependent endonuclease of OLD family
MKLESVRIQNLRAFKDETIAFDDYTCLVGPNGAGKSTVLCALNIFFRSSNESPTNLTNLQEEDFHGKDTSNPIRITVTFGALSSEAQEDFKDYVRQNKLVVSAVAEYDPATKRAEVSQVGERLGIAAFRQYFARLADGEKVPELLKMYSELQVTFPDLKAVKTKDKMTEALHEYEELHTERCSLLASRDEFYGFTRGSNRLAKYVQWVYVPAVKDATVEQQETKEGALGKLLARTVRSKANFKDRIDQIRQETQEKYEQVLEQNQGVLDSLSNALKIRLAEWAHPETGLKVRWQSDEKSVRVDEPLAGIVAAEGDFEGALARFGHGLQRSYLLALLQELSGCDDPSGPTLILACEEPELFQHPPQARHLAGVLRCLSGKNSQVLVCTHSPLFVPGSEFERVRLIRKLRGKWQAKAMSVSIEAISKEIAAAREEKPANLLAERGKLQQELQPGLNEMFFSPVLILVEGIEDYAYITSCLTLMERMDQYRRLGCHIVPVNGKSHMMQPRAIAKALQIPTFTVFDSDGDKPDRNGNREKHRKDNLALLRMCGATSPEPFPKEHFWGEGVVVWNSEMGAVVKAEMGDVWRPLHDETEVKYGQEGGLNKNACFVGDLVAAAWKKDVRPPSLVRLCEEILRFAQAAGGV